MDPGMKFVPATEIVVGVDVPVVTTAGVRVILAPGGGSMMASVAAAEVPPPGVALMAVSERLAAEATSAEVRVTLTWVLLMKVVVRAVPFTSIMVLGTKPVPLTATTGDAVPAGRLAGVTAEITGAGLVTTRFTAVPEPLLAEPLSAMTARFPPFANCSAERVAVT